MCNPLISVIVPIYNAENSLEKCLNSILNQTYYNLQIILVDDGSKDASLEICEKYRKKDSRVIVVHQDNGGASSARNTGISYSNGEFVSFIDSDDWIESETYEYLIDVAKKYDADVVIQPLKFEIHGRNISYNDTQNVVLYNDNEAIKEMLKGQNFTGNVHSKLFKRSKIKLNEFDTKVYIYEDILAMHNILLRCNRVVFVDKHMYHYVMNDGSLMHQSFTEKCLSGRIAVSKITEIITEHLSEETKYVNLFNLRVNYDICNRAYMIRHQNKEVFKREFAYLKLVVNSCYTRDVRELCQKYEMLEFDIIKMGQLAYLIYNFVKRLYRKLRYRQP